MPFHIHTSNRLELLVDTLADTLKNPLSLPLDSEIIIVQSRGMERWVAMELARRLGVCGNTTFFFPNALLYNIFKRLIPDLPDTSLFEPAFLTWKIMKLLSSAPKQEGFENIDSYLEDESPVKCFQLSKRIADVFDQYLVFRPEMLLSWEQGRLLYPENKEEKWQANLWQMIVKSSPHPHRARLMEQFIMLLDHNPEYIERLPERISIFGIPVLPPFHMDFFQTLSNHIEINLFVMNPCRQYWGDIVTEEQKLKLSRQYRKKGISVEDLYLEKGNALLASLGMPGREFFDLILDYDADIIDRFDETGEKSMLADIQSDILTLREQTDKKEIDSRDSSIRIHSCHSPMREIEVLYENLLSMFEEDPDLCPHDIVVMSPDIDTYAPFIRGVFDSPEKGFPKIPFYIADRSMKKESTVFDTFMLLLDLCTDRFGAAQVMTFFESSAVRKKFGLVESDIDLIQQWIADTRIRWGIDEKTRSANDFPPCRENTWRAGLDRLTLGYAMKGCDERIFHNILPYDNIEGDSARMLGRFLECMNKLFDLTTILPLPKSLEEWAAGLGDILNDFFEADEHSESGLHFLRRIITGLTVEQNLSGFDQKVPLKVIREYLKQYLEKEPGASGFITGGVTFCAMLPMRSIPFKIICFVGMNDEAFPRRSSETGFNLMAHDPKPCDRSRKKDDRYLFLETLLSARKKLYISYTGQNIQDNSPIPPSVVVSELLDYLDQGFFVTGKSTYDHVITQHPLQPFSPRYFIGTESLFSFSKENCICAQKLLGPSLAPLPFFNRELAEPAQELKTVEIRDLIAFFSNPAKFLLQHRLGMSLERQEKSIDDRENFCLEKLEKYVFEQELLEKRMSGFDQSFLYSLSRAKGILPHSSVGEVAFEQTFDRVSHFLRIIAPYTGDDEAAPIFIDIPAGNFRVKGRINNVLGKTLLYYRYAKLKPKDILTLWIEHLVLHTAGETFIPEESILVGLKDADGLPIVWKYHPPSNPSEILLNLLAVFWEGLRKPLPFFPEASLAFAGAVVDKNAPDTAALSAAQKCLTGSEFSRGELDDPYFHLCFRNGYQLDEQFKDIALALYRPILIHREKV